MSKLLLVLVLLVLVEVPAFQLGASYLGLGPAWALMLGSAALGCWVLYRGVTLHSARQTSEPGPRELVLDPLGNVICGTLLLVPGFLSDAVGLAILVVPPLRAVLAKLLLKFLGRKALSGGVHWSVRVGPQAGGPAGGDGSSGGAAAGDGGESGDGGTARRFERGMPGARDVRDAEFEVLEDDESDRE